MLELRVAQGCVDKLNNGLAVMGMTASKELV